VAKERSLARDKAFEMYKAEHGEISNRRLASVLGVPEKTISGWKCKDKWDDQLGTAGDQRTAVNGVLQKRGRSTAAKNTAYSNKKRRSKGEPEIIQGPAEENPNLTEKRKLFCLHYVKRFNATQAALNAGYSKDTAYSIGYELLKKPEIRAEIQRLKDLKAKELFVGPMDILNEYAKIAFADIGDFLSFGRRQVQVMGAFGPLYETAGKDGGGNEIKKPVMKTVNYVDLHEKDSVDTSLIAEIKQGRDGVSFKLVSKEKALEKLEQYFDLLPDHYKRKVEDERLKIEREKLAILKLRANINPTEQEYDGFVEALKGEAVNIWADDVVTANEANTSRAASFSTDPLHAAFLDPEPSSSEVSSRSNKDKEEVNQS
jgi:phage terminase small subunit